MQSIKKIRFVGCAVLIASASAAFAHDRGGWAAIHWHTSDFLGLATVGALAVAALWLARRQKRAAMK
jgi:hypothetical protein